MVFWGLAAVALAAWIYPDVAMLLARWRLRSLAEFSPDGPGALPRLTVVVAALNEADTIEPAMRSLLATDYPDLEIVAVDDRSTDATGAILDRLARDHPRLRVEHVRDLPPGWLGKNHALHVGSRAATGTYILFTDADVHFSPDALRRAVRAAEERRLDQLTLIPSLPEGGLGEALVTSFFGTLFWLAARPWRLSNPKSSAFAGVGAFNLVRAEAYARAGGHAALPMDVADDMKLGRVLKRHGAACALFDGGAHVRVRWIVGMFGIVRGLTKNAFGGLSYNPVLAAVAILGILHVTCWPVAGLFVGPPGARALCGASLLAMLLRSMRHRPSPSAPAWLGLGYPLAGPILAYAIFRSMIVTYRQGGIVWRGTLYPLRELRKGVV